MSQVSQDRTRIIATDGSQYSGKKAPTRGTDCPRREPRVAAVPTTRSAFPDDFVFLPASAAQTRNASASSLPRLQAASRPAWLTVALGQLMDGLGGRAHALLLVEKPDLSAPRRRGSRGKGHRSGISSAPGRRCRSGGSGRSAVSELRLRAASAAILGGSVASRGGDSGPATHLHCSPRADVRVQRKRF